MENGSQQDATGIGCQKYSSLLDLCNGKHEGQINCLSTGKSIAISAIIFQADPYGNKLPICHNQLLKWFVIAMKECINCQHRTLDWAHTCTEGKGLPMPHKLKQPPAQESGWAVSDLRVPFSSLDQETLCLLHVLMRLRQRKSICCTFNKNTVQSSQSE